MVKVFSITFCIELFLAWVGGYGFQRCADTVWLLVVMLLFAFLVACAAGMTDALE